MVYHRHTSTTAAFLTTIRKLRHPKHTQFIGTQARPVQWQQSVFVRGPLHAQAAAPTIIGE